MEKIAKVRAEALDWQDDYYLSPAADAILDIIGRH